MHRVSEAFALLAQQVGCGDSAILEDQFICGRTADTHLVLFGTECESGRVLLNDERGEDFLLAAALLNDICVSDDDIDVRFLTVGDEALGAVQDIFICLGIINSLGLNALGVCTCAGLGQTESTQLLTLCQGDQEFLLLLFVAVEQDRITAEGAVGRNDNGSCTADLCHLFYAHNVGKRIAALSAVLLGNGDAHETVFLHLLYGISGENLSFINVNCTRLYFFFSEIFEQISRHFMLFV